MNYSPSSNLEGKISVVTGANSGLGFQTTKMLADMGSKVIMGCRDLEKAKEAKEKIEDQLDSPDIEIMQIDLSDLNSINSFSREFKEKNQRLDIMVNNAGVMHIPFSKTNFGFEYQFGVNHLGHFALNSQLIDIIKRTRDSRVVCVSSLLHRQAKLEFDELNSEENYNRKTAYADSKMANLMYAIELNKMFDEKGIDSKAFAVHPGYSDTNLQIKAAKTTGGKLKLALSKAANKLIAQKSERGALPSVYAATEELDGGEFIGPDGLKQLRGDPEIVEPDSRAKDKELREKLWDFSEEELGIKFDL